jgi:hypothetical protein
MPRFVGRLIGRSPEGYHGAQYDEHDDDTYKQPPGSTRSDIPVTIGARHLIFWLGRPRLPTG